jgi:phospholipase/carboxylesterase
VAVFLHGYGSDERDLPSLAEFLPAGMPWVSLRAPLRHPSSGYSWYELETEFSPDAQILTATDVIWAWVDSQLPEGTLIVPVGFSQGGLMASQLLRSRPAGVAATVVLSGYVARAAQAADAEVAQARPHLFYGRGDADPVIPQQFAADAAIWFEANTEVESRVYAGMGHSVSGVECQDLAAFLSDTLN